MLRTDINILWTKTRQLIRAPVLPQDVRMISTLEWQEKQMILSQIELLRYRSCFPLLSAREREVVYDTVRSIVLQPHVEPRDQSWLASHIAQIVFLRKTKVVTAVKSLFVELHAKIRELLQL